MKEGATPLFQAAQNGHADVCTALLDHNASVNKKWRTGATVLFQSTQTGHANICTVLL